MNKNFGVILLGMFLPSCICSPNLASLFSSPEIDLGHGFSYNDECYHITGDSFDIADHVECYNFDDQYIIAKQRPTYFYDSMYDYPKDFKKEDYSLGIDTTYYWIIDKLNNKAFGPLLSDRYLSVKDSLHIDLELETKEK